MHKSSRFLSFPLKVLVSRREVPEQSLASRLLNVLDDEGLAGFDPAAERLAWDSLSASLHVRTKLGLETH